MKQTPDFDIFKEELTGVNLIEASAGTGKTFTLALLVLRLIIEGERPLAIQEIVAVTFTKAATAELKERIGNFLRISLNYLDKTITAEEADNPPLIGYLNEIAPADINETRKRIEAALLTIDEASIFTIHGFCQRLLIDFAFESGAELGREMIRNQDELIHEVTTNFWRKEVLTLPPEEYACITCEIKDPDSLYNRVHEVLTFPQVRISGLIEQKPDITEKKIRFLREAEEVRTEWNQNRNEAVTLLQDAVQRKILNARSYSSSFFEKGFLQIDSFLAGKSTETKNILKLAYSSMTINKGKENQRPDLPLFHTLDRAIPALEQLVAEIESAEAELITWVETRYISILKTELAAAKEARNQSCFDDIITGVYQALSETNPRRDLFIALAQKRFRAALVDEFQDTDAQQFEIFKALFSKQILFMIGDPKQAIYRFRGGDVYAYLAAKKQPGIKEFTLRTNFRSEKSLIDTLNELFTTPADEPFLTQGIPYHKIESGSSRKPISHDEEEKSPLVIWDIETPISKSGSGGSLSKSKGVDKINALMISEITRLISEPWHVGSSSRKRITPGDLAILVSSHSEGRKLKELLNSAGIPAVTMKSGNICHSDEADTILNILEAVQNPGAVNLLRGILFSPPFSLTAPEIEKELLAIITRFTTYHDLWNEEGVMIMLSELFEKEELFNKLISSQFEAYRPLTNYRHLFELLHTAECQLGIAPLRLIAHLKELKRSPLSDEMQQRMESDESAVKIVTIHASKGLEYPVVFVPYPWAMTYHFSSSGNSSKKIAHPLYYEQNSLHFDISPDADDSRAIAERNEEFQRLFYVALTRASQRLYLSYAEVFESYSKKTEEVFNPAYRFLKDHKEKANPFIEWRTAYEEEPLMEKPPLSEEEKSTKSIRTFTSSVNSGKVTRSYSSIMDHPPLMKREKAEAEKDSIFAFPKGARTGNGWHRIFELIDYTNPESYENGIIRGMEEYGFKESEHLNFAPVRKMVIDTMNHQLNQHKGPEFSLRNIPRTNMVTEMAFHLRADSIDPLYIQQVIEENEGFSVSIKPHLFTGYLQGFIDLLFFHGDQYFIVDWKSNHLGNGPQHYCSKQLEEAMEENEYRLQFILYTVALAQFLKNSLAGFSYEKNIAGAYYVFLRGVNAEGPEGFFYHRPKEKTIMTLLAYFTRESMND